MDWKAEYAVKQVKRIYENLKKSLVQSISEYNVWKPEWDYIRGMFVDVVIVSVV